VVKRVVVAPREKGRTRCTRDFRTDERHVRTVVGEQCDEALVLDAGAVGSAYVQRGHGSIANAVMRDAPSGWITFGA
jgi:hypothetical protein